MYKNLSTCGKVMDRIFTKGVLLGPDWIFVMLSNLRSFLTKRHLKIRKIRDKDLFEIWDNELQRSVYFKNKQQGNLAYRFGLKSRAKEMGIIYLLNNIEFNEYDTIIDCGANYGDLKLYLDQVQPRHKYHAFEPSNEEFTCLKLNIEDGISNNIGLWSNDGKLTFFVSSDGADSSIIEPTDFTDKVEIDVLKLENYIHTKIKLLKLEAEGAEPEVIDGIGDKLHLIEYISADLGPERGVLQHSTLPDVVNKLLERNFVIQAYSPTRSVVLFKNRQYRDTSPNLQT